MRKLYLAFLMLAFVVCLCACGKNDNITLSKADLTGTWELYYDMFAVNQITFNNDGTYVLFYSYVDESESRVTLNYRFDVSYGKFATDNNRIKLVDNDGRFNKEIDFLGINGDELLYYFEISGTEVNPKQYRGKRINNYPVSGLIGNWMLNTPYLWNIKDPHFVFQLDGKFVFNYKANKGEASGRIIYEDKSTIGTYATYGKYVVVKCSAFGKDMYMTIYDTKPKEIHFNIFDVYGNTWDLGAFKKE